MSVTRISRTVLEKTGTKIEKYIENCPWAGKNKRITVTRFGEGSPMRKYGIDTMIDHEGMVANRALISGDTVVLSGTTNVEKYPYIGDFRKLFGELIEKLKQNPVLEKKNHNPQNLYNNRVYNSEAYGINLP